MQFITVMIPLRFQLDALMNDLVWVIKREQRRRIKKTGHLCFFPPVLLLDMKISRWFLWFVAFARGHAVMKVLAFLTRLVRIVFNAALV